MYRHKLMERARESERVRLSVAIVHSVSKYMGYHKYTMYLYTLGFNRLVFRNDDGRRFSTEIEIM